MLKDKLLVLVPDGGDLGLEISTALEKRLRGGAYELENQVFGSATSRDGPPILRKQSKEIQEFSEKLNNALDDILSDGDGETQETESSSTPEHAEEWELMQNANLKLPFELQSVDAVLQTVVSLLINDAKMVANRSADTIAELRGEKSKSSSGLSEQSQERLRLHKDEVNDMEGRIQGFVRAINNVLNDDEDMTLMNLSRLLTHPERFLRPVSKEILHEESDEPELILEAFLQQALTITNSLELLKGKISSTEEQISMTLDAIRNRLLYINTLYSVASLCVAVGSFVGSIFGMNMTKGLETNETAFMKTTVCTTVGTVLMWFILSAAFYRAANVTLR